MTGHIHDEHPFVPPPEHRDQVRRLRGRLTAPVTVFTSGDGSERAGLTVSSVVISEGEPGRVAAVVGDLTDFWDVMMETRRFVVHVLDATMAELAERFAGLRPSPGGPFAGEEIEDTEWGPRLVRVSDWAGCEAESDHEAGYQRLLIGRIAEIHLSELADPLVHFRGHYRRLG